MTKTTSLPCLCASLRRASRSLTQVYEDAFRPLGMRGTQFTVLQVLDYAGTITQGALGGVLAMDSTTLTRTLEILRRRGWIARKHGMDRREWRIGLTRAGEAQLKRCLPAWEKVQKEFGRHLGKKRWQELKKLADEVTAVAQRKGDQS